MQEYAVEVNAVYRHTVYVQANSPEDAAAQAVTTEAWRESFRYEEPADFAYTHFTSKTAGAVRLVD